MVIRMLRRPIYNTLRQFSSALYVTGDRAQKHFAVLTPEIDFDKQLDNKKNLIENIETRRLPIDINKVEERWNYFKEIKAQRDILEETRAEIGKTIAELMKLEQNKKINEEIEKLKTHMKIVKEDLKNLRAISYSVEEGAVLQVLNLPNKLHPKTPHSEELEIYRYLEKSETKTKSHIAIAEERGYVKYINHMSCYLKSQAAQFEYALQNYLGDELISLNYSQFSNSDFVKSVIVEGCGLDILNNKEVLTLEDIHCVSSDEFNKLHLVGASSVYSFMAYFTKYLVLSNLFPLKIFCIGRKYQVVDENKLDRSLFNLNQTSEIGLFIALEDDSDILESVLNDITLMYKQLGYHFRVVLIPASKLKKSESLRLSVQMFSNNLQEYFEVGAISFYGDYISKRLLLAYSENKERKFPCVISGSLINIHKVIGCVLENNETSNQSLLNEFLSKYVF